MATCISCKGEYSEERPEECPRCGANNENWHIHKNLGSLARFSNFFFGSVWGLLALVSLVLPLVPALLWDTFNTVVAMRVVVPLAILLCFIVFLFTHALKLSLREYEWLRRIKRGWNPPLSVISLVAFNLALILGLTVVFVLDSERTRGLERVLLTIAFSLAFVNLTLSAMLMAIRDYARRLDEEVPQPIFMHEDRLRKKIIGAAEKTLGGYDTPLEGLEVQEWMRTALGGVRALLTFNSGELERRVKAPGEEETITVQEEQQWEAIADAWGNLASLQEKDSKRLTQVK
jgi:lysylphosphatidylglycerol synthetase-like protein (DUF2156 family)